IRSPLQPPPAALGRAFCMEQRLYADYWLDLDRACHRRNAPDESAEDGEPAPSFSAGWATSLDESNITHRARARSSSITRVKLSNGWAPATSRPLMQKAGVPVTPARVPSSTSCCTVAWYVPLLTHCSKAGRSSPTSWA